MSLKYFHLVFLFFAILCDAGFWLWTRLLPEQAEALGVAYLGHIAGWSSIALIIYGIWYAVRKARTIIV